MQKTALITGGGSGLGQALAWEFAKRDFQVVIVGRHESTLNQTKARFPNMIHFIKADIANQLEHKLIVERLAHLKKLDYLIQNAGTVEPICPIKEMSLEKFNHTMSTNFLGPLFLTKQLLPHLIGARILHISTLLAHQAMRHFGGYCISKAALYMSKDILNAELNDENILFGSVMPGMIDTAMQSTLRDPEQTNFPEQKYFIHSQTQNRLVKPEVSAKFLSYILLQSSDAEFIQGEWDIYETKHHQYWLEDEELPLPL